MEKQQHSSVLQTGESLLEVMISLLIFCFAILGLLGIQQRIMLQMYATESAVIASQFSINLAEQIGGLPPLIITQLDGSKNPVAELACPVDSCNSAWINSQISHWQQQLETELPQSEIYICLDDTPADGSPNLPACQGMSRLAVKIWPRNHEYPMVAALDL